VFTLYVQGGPRPSKRSTPVKSGYFTDIGLSSMKTVTDMQCIDILLIITSTSDGFSGVYIDDLKRR